MRKKLLFIPLVLAGIAILAAVVMLLWNSVMPGLFAGSAQIAQIDYWRALGLLVLCRILFGGSRGRRGYGGGGARWQAWQAMTPEEREQFRSSRASFCRPTKDKA